MGRLVETSRMRILLLSSVCVALLLPACCFSGADVLQGLGDSVQSATFMTGCETECRAGGSGEACPAYCACMNARINADHQSEHMEQLALLPQDEMMRDPWFQTALASCGQTIHDDGFRRGCMENCPGDCTAYCDCTMTQLRSGMTVEEGTLWMVQNLDLGITPAGQARLDQAVEACASTMPQGATP